MNAAELLERYAAGDRDFSAANLQEVVLEGENLSGSYSRRSLVRWGK
ncbi:MAG: pentapeptide repeat-containing protein, partial [Leptolyngbyaceae cyanobacterium SL_7_1]|nr:pentapeptide repeat-containing protein [Leptolyngbyaceae cyanobacterium SL_7_1]